MASLVIIPFTRNILNISVLKLPLVTTLGSDPMGMLMFDFYNLIIPSDSEKNPKGYKIKTINNGAVEIMLLPKKQ
jgi:hypothetical protein